MVRSVFLLWMLLLMGCGPSGPKRVPVSGKVNFVDGKPVPGGIIECLPTAGGLSARGRIETNGQFILDTGGQPGAVVGAYRVIVIQIVQADGAAQHVGSHHAKLVVHPKYAKADSSGLTLNVPEEGLTDAVITVDTAAPGGKGW